MSTESSIAVPRLSAREYRLYASAPRDLCKRLAEEYRCWWEGAAGPPERTYFLSSVVHTIL